MQKMLANSATANCGRHKMPIASATRHTDQARNGIAPPARLLTVAPFHIPPSEL